MVHITIIEGSYGKSWKLTLEPIRWMIWSVNQICGEVLSSLWRVSCIASSHAYNSPTSVHPQKKKNIALPLFLSYIGDGGKSAPDLPAGPFDTFLAIRAK